MQSDKSNCDGQVLSTINHVQEKSHMIELWNKAQEECVWVPKFGLALRLLCQDDGYREQWFSDPDCKSADYKFIEHKFNVCESVRNSDGTFSQIMV